MNTTLPYIIEEKLELFFPSESIFKSINLLKNSQVKIDYMRGRPDGPYYIVSGAIIENRLHTANFKIKKRPNETSLLTSYCDCSYWNPEHHCHHIASLFIKYHMQYIDSELTGQGPNNVILNSEFGAKCKNFGTIINHAYQLAGVAKNLTFHACQYTLENGNVTSLPHSKTFQGTLVIDLVSSIELYYDKDINLGQSNLDPSIVTPRFLYFNEEGTLIKEISLFEHTHLFDWTTGEYFVFNSALRDFIYSIRFKNLEYNLNDYIRKSYPFIKEKKIKLLFSGEEIDLSKAVSPHARCMINLSERKNYLNVQFDFLNNEEHLCQIPTILQLVCFEYGLLSSFKKKRDGQAFIKQLIDFIEAPESFNVSLIRSSGERELVESLVENLVNEVDEYIFDINNHTLFKYEGHFLKNFVFSIFKCFGENFFRFSKFDQSEKNVSFEASTNNILDGISSFNTRMYPLGMKVYYNKMEVMRWNSRIKFERNKSSLNWFELDLKISKEDLEIIKKSEMDKDFLVTTKGLILLGQDQKQLLRFMKKYTKFEAKEMDQVEEEPGSTATRYKLSLSRARIFELFELKKLGLNNILTDEENRLCENLLNLTSMPKYEVPVIKTNSLRPYQLQGYQWLRFLYENKLGACLADDMGLGKTLQTIIFLKSIYTKDLRVLIVCPVSIIINWENEFLKFSDLGVSIYYGGERNYDPSSPIVLTSYGILKKEYETTFKDQHFDILIMDEVQHLKNLKSLGAKSAREISAKFRICLTGTPVENDLSEFYNILDLSVPGIWGDLKFIKAVSNGQSRMLAKKTARPFILRRTKNQVLRDLPEKIENHIFLSFDEEQQEFYSKNLLRIKSQIENVVPRKKYGEILKGLLELRQLCLWQKRAQLQSTKIDFLMENIEQILSEGHQAIIFSQFTTYLDYIQKYFEERTWRFSRIDGTRSFTRRQKDIDLFQSGKTSLFLISLKAGGVGLNLTAASYVFLMDPWWNPAVEAQAIDRAHRIGQKNKLTVYRPIIKGTVEEKVLKLQEMKKELFLDLMSDDDDSYFSGKLTMDDFRQLLD